MNRTPTWRERLKYAFDQSMSAGTGALIGWLALISLAIIVMAAVLLSVTGIAPGDGEPLGFGESLWESTMRAMDAGTVAGDSGWGFRFVMLGVTLAGIFIVSLLVSILASGLQERLTELRKGRSQVLESGHTIILNWSSSIFDIISELAIANASERTPRIVILSTRDKAEMEDEIAAKVSNLGRMRIICRSGDPTDLFDLSLTSPMTSKSIIVLSPEGDHPDAAVLKTILALVHDPKRRAQPYRIAAEIRTIKNADIARTVGGKEVQLVFADDLISRIVVHSSRQAGLSAVYSDLLDFDGCEIYTSEQKGLAGKTYGEALGFFESCAVMGLVNGDGSVKVNPSMDRVIAADERIILIAEDDAAIKISQTPAPPVQTALMATAPVRETKPERGLLLGWNRRGAIMLRELSRYVEPGSSITVIADTPHITDDIAALQGVSDQMTVHVTEADSSDRETLAALDVTSFDHVMVLSYSDTLPAQSADTRTLITLLHMRQLADDAGGHVSVVSEMVDVRNRELAEVTRADDFVVSNKLVSLMLAQASENPYLSAIFDDLLDEQGSEIYMRPASDYLVTGQPVDFYTVLESARQRGETAIGHVLHGKGCILNPCKSEKAVYGEDDRIIVLAEN